MFCIRRTIQEKEIGLKIVEYDKERLVCNVPTVAFYTVIYFFIE